MRFALTVTLAILFAPVLSPAALAFDFFGLFGGEPPLPTPSRENLPYDTEIKGLEDKDTLSQALRDNSNLWQLRREPPPTGDGLVRRAIADIPRMAENMWGAGYYNAEIRVSVAGRPLNPDGDNPGAASAAEALRAHGMVPVTVSVTPGPMFRLRDVRVYDARTNQPLTPDLIPPRGFPLKPGDEASAGNIRTGASLGVAYLRDNSRPLAKLVSIAPVVQHPSATMDIAIAIDPSQTAGFGLVTVQGAKDLDPRVVESYIYLQPGEPYYPQRLADTRKSVSKIEAVGSVRIDEADRLDANGNLPVTVTVTERPRHSVGASAAYSTADGPTLRTWWMDRNLFGGGERLRFDVEGGYAIPTSGIQFKPIAKASPENLIGRVKASFIKPALGGSRNDLLIDARVARERTNSYIADTAGATVAIRRRFSENTYFSLGVDGERGRVEDILGTVDYTLIGLQASASYDSTDSLLNPTKGMRAIASFSPYAKAFGSTLNLLQTKAQASAYYSLDEDSKYILAGRLAVGSLAGADLIDIPANRRFFAGGGGSVRGFSYKSLSPLGPFGIPIGGRSLVEGSLEARIKITDTIGIVPFVDAGNAAASSVPNFKDGVRVGAGLGLRYFTAIGPIRLDVAMPLNRKNEDPRYGIYVGLGQSF
ncbi:MAG: hypothetical protein JWO28_2728 [Hyphomicrobiales bacterium]|nr:hypothetical protein [Hyphomicrobiales bacterium]